MTKGGENWPSIPSRMKYVTEHALAMPQEAPKLKSLPESKADCQ